MVTGMLSFIMWSFFFGASRLSLYYFSFSLVAEPQNLVMEYVMDPKTELNETKET